MFDNFITDINYLYDLILQSSDIMRKKNEISRVKKELEIERIQGFGKVYYKNLKADKRHGIVYTPGEIANYMIEESISAEDIINNPYLKIIDPACGTGNILIPCFRYLKGLFTKNLKIINIKHNLNLKEEDISCHIISNNLYGCDIDELSIKILILDLFCESDFVSSEKIYKCDFLIDNKHEEKYNIIIGNPPYVGHKAVDREYSSLLKRIYKGIYKDKGDISYCFFKRAMELIKKGGRISFITSRYFMEAPSGIELRRMIKKEAYVKKIFDFYGIRPFKEAGIDPVIIFLNLYNSGEDIEVIRPRDRYSANLKDVFISIDSGFDTFNVGSSALCEDGWVLLNSFEKRILDKIRNKCSLVLENICTSNQGIITGGDAAFIVTKEIIQHENLEQDIIKPWIKGKNINKFSVASPSKYLIYSNSIDREENYPNIIRHISAYKEKLLTRRECRKGMRKWYELQWGRKPELFEGNKIVFPYKSANNRFAMDKGSFFSADIYSMSITNADYANYTLLLQLLNSCTYDFYFKTFAKKLGDTMYEYYPNKVMKLRLPDIRRFKNINDDILFDYFGFDREEREYVKKTFIL